MTNENPTAPLRLFVAIPIPEPVRDEIIRVQRELQPLVPRDLARWPGRINFISRSGSWATFRRTTWKT